MDTNYQTVMDKIKKDQVILLDGGTGTELQKRGLEMAPGAWCGPVSLKNADILEQVHLDYIKAGADIITANTYASSRIMLREAGYENQFREINQTAIEAALNAREKSNRKDVLVAGSLSHMIPVSEGSDRIAKTTPPQEFMEEAFEELAMLHQEYGCDLILLEMMKHPQRIHAVMKGAIKTGLPLWAGFSFREDESGNLTCYDDPQIPIKEVLDAIHPESIEVMGVMHTSANLTGTSLEKVKNVWDGPLCAYPDSGFFKMPEWQFEKILTPAEFLKFSQEWYGQGVRIFGGCCGLGPEHIQALSELTS